MAVNENENRLTKEGLKYFWLKLKVMFANKVDKVEGKGLSTNDLTDDLKSNYDSAYTHSQSGHAPSDAEKNTMVGIKKNGVDLPIDSATRKVDISVPTKTSDLNNDSGFITTKDIPEGAAASTTTPKMDGVASVGKELAFARGDHIHPRDTSKVDKEEGKGLSTNDYTTEEKDKLSGIESGANKTIVDTSLSSSSTNPVQNKVVTNTLGNKVDKVEGKGLSTNDYTTEEKVKLEGIESGANYYVLPDASTNSKGGVKLSTSVSSNSETMAATPSAVKAAYDLANSKQSPATSLEGYGIMNAYTKQEVDSIIATKMAESGHLKREIVDTKPSLSEAKENVIYMVLEDSENSENRYIEWMLVNGELERVGSSDVDLTNYVTKDEIVPITTDEIDAILLT